jgi:hypothetical protein
VEKKDEQVATRTSFIRCSPCKAIARRKFSIFKEQFHHIEETRQINMDCLKQDQKFQYGKTEDPGEHEMH